MPHSSTQSNPLLGTWALVSAIALHADGTVDPEVYGSNPVGYITYTEEGRVMVMFARSNRALFSQTIGSPLSSELRAIPVSELAEAFTTFNAYAGRYTLNGNTVIHHIEIASIPNRVGTELVRTFTVDGNRVTLKTSPILHQGTLQVFELVWEKIQART